MIACDLCGHDKPDYILQARGLDGPLVRCPACGLYYVGARNSRLAFEDNISAAETVERVRQANRNFRDLDPMAPAAGSLLCGAAILIPLSLVVDQPWTLAPSMNSLLALLGLAVFSTAFAFVIYFRLIQTLGSIGATAQAYLRVPIGVAASVVFLGEQLSPTAWIGLGCVVIGVAAMTVPVRKTRPAGEAA